MQLIVKRRGHSEPYDERKVYSSIVAACKDSGEPSGSAELVADHVVKELRDWLETKHEVTSHDIRHQAAHILDSFNENAARNLLEGGHRVLKKSKTKVGKKPRHFDYDAIVIGTGAAGGVAARKLNSKGLKVAIVEESKFGGECPNYACIPTKALLQSAKMLNSVRNADKFGIKTGDIKINYAEVKAWQESVVQNSSSYESAQAFKLEGIGAIQGRAHFISPWTISVAGKRYSAEQFLIASGTKSVVPAIPGLKDAGFIDYRGALELDKPPHKLFIVGGGAIGCEFAHFFNTFGSKVHIAEHSEQLLSREDPDVGETVGEVFAASGIQVHVNSKVVKIEKKGRQKQVTYESGGQLHDVMVDEILIATGKAPNTDLGLENAQVEYSKEGIAVDREMRTSSPHIYAAGDVVGGYMFTHVAVYQGEIAAQNMTSQLKHRADYRAVPRCVFIEPEVACVGSTEAELKQKQVAYQTAVVAISNTTRASLSKTETGFIKLIASHKGVLLGASIVAPRADDLIHELMLAIQWGMKASKIEYSIHAFPTWSRALRQAAAKISCN